jgi:chemotaxis response regulator CheB
VQLLDLIQQPGYVGLIQFARSCLLAQPIKINARARKWCNIAPVTAGAPLSPVEGAEMATRDIIVIGASAGGVDALMRLCSALPKDLPASIFVAQHLSPSSRSLLPTLLDRAGPLTVVAPVDCQVFERGHVYVAPPDHHLLVRDDRVLLRRSPYENRTRPSVNALFRSAAVAHGGRVIGVVLTGLLDDGTDGLVAIKAAGGTSIVQDPDDAEWSSMPRNALMHDHVDHVVTLADLPGLLNAVSREGAQRTAAGGLLPRGSDRRRRIRPGRRSPRVARRAEPTVLPRLRRGAQPDRDRRRVAFPLPGRPCVHPARPRRGAGR